MRPSNKSRSRNKPGGGSNNNQRRSMGNIINRVFESAGPDSKVRGTPQQIIDKYNGLARDAQLSGDRVAAENYLQHAEHYSRLLGEAQRQQQDQRQAHDRDDQQPRHDGQSRQEDQPRRDSQYDQPRQDSESRQDDQPRQNDQRGDRQPERHQEPARQRPDRARSEASGLTTIEPEDTSDDGGPVDTPESGQHRLNGSGRAPADKPASTEATNGADHGSDTPEQQEASASPTKRPRTRRRAKAEPDAEVPAASTD